MERPASEGGGAAFFLDDAAAAAAATLDAALVLLEKTRPSVRSVRETPSGVDSLSYQGGEMQGGLEVEHNTLIQIPRIDAFRV